MAMHLEPAFFSFVEDSTKDIPVIVTNKHVIRGAVKGTFLLTGTNPDGSPPPASSIRVVLNNFESDWIPDPNPNVDPEIMPIAPVINEAFAKGKTPCSGRMERQTYLPKMN